jgi:Methyltransferase domain
MTRVNSSQPSWLQQRLTNGAILGRTLVRHPMALTTIGTRFSADAPVEFSSPWWNRYAIRYFSSQLRRGDRVFEWGSGSSTAWMVEQGAKVTSIEHDPEWVAKVTNRCPGADVRAIPAKPTGTIEEPWFKSDKGPRFFDDYVSAIDEFDDGSFDIVIVDGMCRVECFQRAVPKVRPGGLLVVDDIDMEPYRPLKKSLPGWKAEIFAGFKSSRDLRETAFFRRPA